MDDFVMKKMKMFGRKPCDSFLMLSNCDKTKFKLIGDEKFSNFLNFCI